MSLLSLDKGLAGPSYGFTFAELETCVSCKRHEQARARPCNDPLGKTNHSISMLA